MIIAKTTERDKWVELIKRVAKFPPKAKFPGGRMSTENGEKIIAKGMPRAGREFHKKKHITNMAAMEEKLDANR